MLRGAVDIRRVEGDSDEPRIGREAGLVKCANLEQVRQRTPDSLGGLERQVCLALPPPGHLFGSERPRPPKTVQRVRN